MKKTQLLHTAYAARAAIFAGTVLASSSVLPGPAAAQLNAALPSGESLETPSEIERGFPQLPADFDRREPAEPEALLRIVLEGYTGVVFQDNVYRAPSDRKSDLLWIGAPRARLIHDGPEVDAEIAVEAEIGRYFDETRNDYEDFALTAGLVRGDLASDFMRLRGSYGRSHQSIGADIDTPDREAAEVTEFWRGEFLFDAAYRAGAFLFAPEARARNFDYRDSRRLDGTRIDNQGKSRTEIDAVPRLGWGIQPDLFLLVDPGVNWRLYDEDFSGARGFDRDSYGLRPRVGARYGTDTSEFAAVSTIGLALQDYQDDRLKTITTLGFLGVFDWRFLPQQALRLEVERDIGETTLAGASGTISTRGRVSYSYAVTEKLDVRAAAEFDNREFVVNSRIRPDDRTDEIIRVGADVTYRLTKVGFVGLGLDYVDRDSNDPTVRNDGFEASARVGARF